MTNNTKTRQGLFLLPIIFGISLVFFISYTNKRDNAEKERCVVRVDSGKGNQFEVNQHDGSIHSLDLSVGKGDSNRMKIDYGTSGKKKSSDNLENWVKDSKIFKWFVGSLAALISGLWIKKRKNKPLTVVLLISLSLSAMGQSEKPQHNNISINGSYNDIQIVYGRNIYHYNMSDQEQAHEFLDRINSIFNLSKDIPEIRKYDSAIYRLALKAQRGRIVDQERLIAIVKNYIGDCEKLKSEVLRLSRKCPDSTYAKLLRSGLQRLKVSDNIGFQADMEAVKQDSTICDAEKYYAEAAYLQARNSLINDHPTVAAYQIEQAYVRDSSVAKYCFLKAEVLRQLNKNAESLEIYLQLLKKKPDDSLKTDIYNNVGLIYLKATDSINALSFLTRSVSLKERIFGPSDLRTTNSYNNLGDALLKFGRLDEAEDYFRKALSAIETNYGKECFESEEVYNNLGLVFRSRKIYDSSLTYLKKALAIKERKFPDWVPGMAFSYLNISNIYDIARQQDQAWEYSATGLKIITTFYGDLDSMTIPFYYNQGLIQLNKRDAPDSASSLTTTLTIVVNTFGKEDKRTAKWYHTVGGTYARYNKHELAISCYNTELAILQHLLSQPPDDSGKLFVDIGSEYILLGDEAKAKAMFLRSRFTNDDLAKQLCNKAQKRLDHKNYIESAKLSEFALRYVKATGKHKSFKLCISNYDNIARAYRCLGDQTHAKKAQRKAAILSKAWQKQEIKFAKQSKKPAGVSAG